MTDLSEKALLPAGLADLLPSEAHFEARVTERLMAIFQGFGYARVKPPLIEFEESLITGSGEATAAQTFRLMDPVSQRMLGVRPDMTVQISRIAATRLADEARPLRLAYAGQVLRVKGSSLRPERQFSQVGAELIGSPSPRADTEVIRMAFEALRALEVGDLSVDLGAPGLLARLADAPDVEMDCDRETLRAALDHKDAAAIEALGGRAAGLFAALVDAAGPAKEALVKLAKLDLPDGASAERAHLAEVAALLDAQAPGLKVTVDPAEIRGYEYHTGITFTFFSRSVPRELGRGGRYMAGHADASSMREPATGITFFLDSLIHAVPRPAAPDQVYLPLGAPAVDATVLRDAGWIAVSGLEKVADAEAEAARLGCTHLWTENGTRAVGGDEKERS